MRTTLAVLALTVTMTASAQTIPAEYWPEAKSAEILAKTETIRLAPDLSRLSAGERETVTHLLAVGRIMQRLYEEQRHHQALRASAALNELDAKLGHPKRLQNLIALYRLNQGPIASTLDNKREPFLPVDAQVPGRNMYPPDVTKAEVDAFLAAHPEQRDAILGERTVVRRATTRNLEWDLGVLASNAAIGLMNERLAHDLKTLARNPDPKVLYAVPYSVAYADEMIRAYRHLIAAADAVQSSDEEFARYLRNRARDLLSNDYEAGDASWVTGRYKNLNAQIGSYETYDDALYGVKAFHSLSLLLTNEAATKELRSRLGGLQEIEDALPYDNHKRVREDISVGVYDVIADFGQARGTNTATILPNDALFSRRYGRTIMLRENIMTHPDIFAADMRVWRAATADAHAADLAPVGNFQRTLWHEIGHYLGVDRDKQGRTLDVALESHADAVEEMKSDLVSLFALQRMKHPSLRPILASGIRRTLQNVKPRSDQPYQTMQLAQFNYFLEKGLITADPQTARLTIHYEKYPEVVTALLREVLSLQHEGDKDAAAKFFARWGAWTPELHEKLAARIREAQGARWRLVRYAALGE
jgi:predicted Zn-dependent protease with MMP-like domain